MLIKARTLANNPETQTALKNIIEKQVVANVTHATSAFADGNAATEVAAAATDVAATYVPPSAMEIWSDQFTRLREVGGWG